MSKPIAQMEIEEAVPSPAGRVLRKMWHLRLGVAGGLVILALLLTALFCPYFAPHDPYQQNITNRLKPPAWMEKGQTQYLLGTDHLGRDLFSRILYGSRISLVVGISAALLMSIIGVGLGLVAGYYGGRIDSLISLSTKLKPPATCGKELFLLSSSNRLMMELMSEIDEALY